MPLNRRSNVAFHGLASIGYKVDHEEDTRRLRLRNLQKKLLETNAHDTAWLVVYRSLMNMANLTKNKNREASQTYRQDAEWCKNQLQGSFIDAWHAPMRRAPIRPGDGSDGDDSDDDSDSGSSGSSGHGKPPEDAIPPPPPHHPHPPAPPGAGASAIAEEIEDLLEPNNPPVIRPRSQHVDLPEPNNPPVVQPEQIAQQIEDLLQQDNPPQPIPIQEPEEDDDIVIVDDRTTMVHGPTRYGVGQFVRTDEQVEIVGDGNCLFRSIAYAVYGDQNLHERVRREIVAWARAHRQEVARWFGDNELDAHLNMMDRHGRWGTHLELWVAGRFYAANIEVFESRRVAGGYMLTNFIRASPWLENPRIRLWLNHPPGHYSVLHVERIDAVDLGLLDNRPSRPDSPISSSVLSPEHIAADIDRLLQSYNEQSINRPGGERPVGLPVPNAVPVDEGEQLVEHLSHRPNPVGPVHVPIPVDFRDLPRIRNPITHWPQQIVYLTAEQQAAALRIVDNYASQIEINLFRELRALGDHARQNMYVLYLAQQHMHDEFEEPFIEDVPFDQNADYDSEDEAIRELESLLPADDYFAQQVAADIEHARRRRARINAEANAPDLPAQVEQLLQVAVDEQKDEHKSNSAPAFVPQSSAPVQPEPEPVDELDDLVHALQQLRLSSDSIQEQAAAVSIAVIQEMKQQAEDMVLENPRIQRMNPGRHRDREFNRLRQAEYTRLMQTEGRAAILARLRERARNVADMEVEYHSLQWQGAGENRRPVKDVDWERLRKLKLDRLQRSQRAVVRAGRAEVLNRARQRAGRQNRPKREREENEREEKNDRPVNYQRVDDAEPVESLPELDDYVELGPEIAPVVSTPVVRPPRQPVFRVPARPDYSNEDEKLEEEVERLLEERRAENPRTAPVFSVPGETRLDRLYEMRRRLMREHPNVPLFQIPGLGDLDLQIDQLRDYEEDLPDDEKREPSIDRVALQSELTVLEQRRKDLIAANPNTPRFNIAGLGLIDYDMNRIRRQLHIEEPIIEEPDSIVPPANPSELEREPDEIDVLTEERAEELAREIDVMLEQRRRSERIAEQQRVNYNETKLADNAAGTHLSRPSVEEEEDDDDRPFDMNAARRRVFGDRIPVEPNPVEVDEEEKKVDAPPPRRSERIRQREQQVDEVKERDDTEPRRSSRLSKKQRPNYFETPVRKPKDKKHKKGKTKAKVQKLEPKSTRPRRRRDEEESDEKSNKRERVDERLVEEIEEMLEARRNEMQSIDYAEPIQDLEGESDGDEELPQLDHELSDVESELSLDELSDEELNSELEDEEMVRPADEQFEDQMIDNNKDEAANSKL